MRPQRFKSITIASVSTALWTVLSVLTTGCATTEYMAMPHLGPEAFCAQGDCNNGYGTKQAKQVDYSVEGHWQNSDIVDGDYKVSFKGKTWTTHYRNGGPETGAKLYQHSQSNEFDLFVGSWQSYTDPFSGTKIFVPLDGTYTTATGFQFSGVFKVFPTMGGSRGLYKEAPEGQFWPYLNTVFIGMIEYNGQKEVGIYVRRDWMVSTPLVSSYEGLVPADDAILKRLQNETRSDLATRDHWQIRQKQSDFDIDFGKVFALAAGVAMASRSGLSSDTQLEFITAYSRDVMSGSTSNLETLKGKYADNRSANEILTDFNQSAASYYKQSAAATPGMAGNGTTLASGPTPNSKVPAASTPVKQTSAQQKCLTQRDFLWLQDEQRCISKNTFAAKQCGQAGGSYTNNGCIINTKAYPARFPNRTLTATTSLFPGMPSGNVASSGREDKQPDKPAAKPAKQECVARNESGIALPRVASNYCRYVLSDYTRTAEYTFENAKWGFDSSVNEDGAKDLLKYNLKELAEKKCKAEGYTTVFNDDTLKANDVTPSIRECKSKKIFGSDEYACRGTTSFFCGRYQSAR